MRHRLLRLLPGLAVSAGFTIWFLWRAHWAEVGAAMAGVRPVWVVLSAAMLFTEFLLRTLRWKVLLRPLAPGARYGRLFVATVIGMSLNVVLPFRAGDFARPWLGHRETGVPMLPLVTIAVIERVFDLLGLLVVLLVMTALLPASAEGDLVSRLQTYGAVLGAGGLLGLGVFITMAFQDQTSRTVMMRLLRLLPGPIAAKIGGLYDGLAVGLASVRSPRSLVEAAGISALHWLNGATSILLLFRAFDITLPFSAACFNTVAIAVAAALPQAPGFFGVFHVATESALRLWGLDPAPAQAFAIVFWGVSFVPVATVGAFLWWREGLDRRMLNR